ncbi:Arginase/deacetylase [Cutaneotrichosporon oleaginosum]|uniref:Arginase/deacetylase n=1 Tax=Cutaneotrichosporon oleaginosum TaxID=879819 RepID=A0A0J0XWN6_9TREE|nr:Arginase/deacetylase [Cutaneotrichosporon oleaginosum]KLT45466.1 Arginase/deacetylase [Cutaneotrichosporon oleaginosum]TXT14578.1 hypothetical protein COLE_00771 [Cutaneotrichosporon oleaginosum]
MASVAYIWSPELQRAADELPANVGRSSLVHGLVRALGLLENSLETAGEVKDGVDGGREACGNGEGNGEGSGEGNENGNVDGDGEGDGDGNGHSGVCPSSAASMSPRSHDEDTDDDDHGEPVEPPIHGVRLVPPDPSLATRAELRRYHDQRYLDYVLQPYAASSSSSSSSSSDSDASSDNEDGPRKRRREAMGLEDDCPRFPALRAYVPLVAAATLTACRLLARGTARTAIVWDGGRHHALRAKASGFCYVADAVLGILLLAREGMPRSHLSASATAIPQRTRRARIMYLDMDLHYGDGVATAFTSPTHYPYPLLGRPRAPQVLTLSIHHQSRVFFPPGAPGLTSSNTPHPFSLSLPLAAFAHAPSYARAWKCVEMIKAAWDPDYVVLQLGVDGLPGDRIGQWGAWSPHGEGGSTWVVQRVIGWGVPSAVLGGGGYEHANAARAWALATGVIVGKEISPKMDVPDHENIEAFAPGFTLEVPESNVPDENTEDALAAAESAFEVLAERIREIVAL